MNQKPATSWLNRLLEMTVTLTVVAVLLNWAWQLIRPLIPVVVVTAGLGFMISLIVQRRRSW